jgi:hypothetical protein
MGVPPVMGSSCLNCIAKAVGTTALEFLHFDATGLEILILEMLP